MTSLHFSTSLAVLAVELIEETIREDSVTVADWGPTDSTGDPPLPNRLGWFFNVFERPSIFPIGDWKASTSICAWRSTSCSLWLERSRSSRLSFVLRIADPCLGACCGFLKNKGETMSWDICFSNIELLRLKII